MTSGNVEVFHENGYWRIRIDGGETKPNILESQDQAVDVARDYAQALGVELIIRNLDGTIAERDSHGLDPRKVLG